MQEIAHASLHLIGSFVREGHGQDGFRPNLQVVDQMGDSVGNDASLPAARAREDKNRAFSGLNSFELLWIEKLTEIHVEQLLDSGLASISPRVFYRHQENSNRGIQSLEELRGSAQQKVHSSLSAVGAVYDRAFVPLDCKNCAVIDRAYSKKVCVCGLLCKAGVAPFRGYSTVTLFARFRGWSTSQPRRSAM